MDVVITVHNHSAKVQQLFSELFNGEFHNLYPAELYADYIKYSDMVVTGKDGDNLVLCSPDDGAAPFMNAVWDSLGLPKCARIVMHKERTGERQVKMAIDPQDRDLTLEGIAGKDIIVLDDMVRTGSTIVECCRLLRQGNPGKVCFGVTHFLSGAEARENLNSKYIDEILTLNTIPSVLNRDSQGRLRKKMTVLKIEKWIARFLLQYMGKNAAQVREGLLFRGHVLQEPPLAAAGAGTDSHEQNLPLLPSRRPRRLRAHLAGPGRPCAGNSPTTISSGWAGRNTSSWPPSWAWWTPGTIANPREFLGFYTGEMLPKILDGVSSALLWMEEEPKLRVLLHQKCQGPFHIHPPFPASGEHVMDYHLQCLPYFSLPAVSRGGSVLPHHHGQAGLCPDASRVRQPGEELRPRVLRLPGQRAQEPPLSRHAHPHRPGREGT